MPIESHTKKRETPFHRPTRQDEIGLAAERMAFQELLTERQVFQNFLRDQKPVPKRKKAPTPPPQSSVISVALPKGHLKQKSSAFFKRKAAYAAFKTGRKFKDTAIVSDPQQAFSAHQMMGLDNGVYDLATFTVNHNAFAFNLQLDEEEKDQRIKILSAPIMSIGAVYDGHLSLGATVEDATECMTSLFQMLARHERKTKLAISTLENIADVGIFKSLQHVPADIFAQTRTVFDSLASKSKKPSPENVSVYEFG